MSQRQESPATRTRPMGVVRTPPTLTHGYSGALSSLTKAFAERRPVALVVGQSAMNSAYLIDRFLDAVRDDATVARITEPCTGPEAALRALLEAFQIDPGQHHAMEKLESKAERFLSQQKKRGLRTIICFECSRDIEPWAVDRVRRLVDLETRENIGLMVILASRPGLSTLLAKPPFDVIGSCAGQQIVAGPLNADETRDYIARQVEGAGIEHINQVFELSAITVVHELCAGDIEKIEILTSECIEMADDQGISPVSTSLVQLAHDRIRDASEGKRVEEADPGQQAVPSQSATGRLIARINDVTVQEYPIHHEHVLIGRGDQCDIVVDCHIVSRYHALVIYSTSGISLLDLGSKNGTFVDGRRVNQHLLQNGDLIGVGDRTITYFAGSGA